MSLFQKILVATDFSENASAIYAFTEEVAKNFGASVDLIYVIPKPLYLPVDIHAVTLPLDESKEKEFSDKMKAQLDSEMQASIPKENRGKTILKSGNPADEVNACASEGRYDLIMIASRGEGNSIFNKGSVTEKLMRISHVPVWSVLKGNDTAIKSIVVPTDGSAISLEALPLACKLAAKRNAKIDLLSVSKANFTHIMPGDYIPYTHKDDAIKTYILRSLQEYLSEQTSTLQFEEESVSADKNFRLLDEAGNNIEVSIVVKKGDSAHLAIVEYAEKNAQLVVMATHGHCKLASMFAGSTTENVFRNIKIPVMTVKPEFVR